MDRDVSPHASSLQNEPARRRSAPGVAALAALAVLAALVPSPAGAAAPPGEGDVVRFLEQATFGPSLPLFSHVASVGFERYLAEQVDAKASRHATYPPYPLDTAVGCPDGSPSSCFRDNYTMYPLQVAFYKHALENEDQVRQRVAFALHQILVVSGVKLRQPSQMAPYLNLLADGAFGSYRKLLEDITLSPAMGAYLDMVNNQAASGTASPNENYAREVLQLFSVGVHLLEPDGTLRRDARGEPIPAYSQETITAFARVFTGWTYATASGVAPARRNPPNFTAPMWLYRDGAGRDVTHDKGAKTLLDYPGAVSATLPAGQDGLADLSQALDNIFHHPNVGPFIGKQLIQHLVTSNPSPAYVGRVAAAFANNGKGVRGDLAAVVKAILLDPEARGDLKTDPDYGRLREPVLFVTNLCRAFGASSDGILAPQSRSMGQDLFNPATVFGYYPHSYRVPGTSVEGPELGILSSVTSMARVNFVNTLAFGQVRSPAPDPGTKLDLSALAYLAGSPASLVSGLNMLLHGSMSAGMAATLGETVAAIPAGNPALRTQTALYLVASSSQYQVAR